MKIKRMLVVLLALVLVMSYSTPVFAVTKYCTVTFKYDDSTFKKTVRYGGTIDMDGTMFVRPEDKKFVKWDKSLKNIKKNMTVTAVFRDYVPHVVFSKTVATGDKFNFGTNIDTYSNFTTTWSTSDKTIATVSSKGVVTTLKAGDVTITFKAYKKGVGTTYFVSKVKVLDDALSTEYVKTADDGYANNSIPSIIANDTLTMGDTDNLGKCVDFGLEFNANPNPYEDTAGSTCVYYNILTNSDENGNELSPAITCTDEGIVTAIAEGTTTLSVDIWDYHMQGYRAYKVIYTVVAAK